MSVQPKGKVHRLCGVLRNGKWMSPMISKQNMSIFGVSKKKKRGNLHEVLDPWLTIGTEQKRPRSEYADLQADLSLCCSRY